MLVIRRRTASDGNSEGSTPDVITTGIMADKSIRPTTIVRAIRETWTETMMRQLKHIKTTAGVHINIECELNSVDECAEDRTMISRCMTGKKTNSFWIDYCAQKS
jgi:hypothetical protein